MLCVIDQVYVGKPHDLCRRWHVCLTCETFTSVLGRIYNEWSVIMVPVCNFFIVGTTFYLQIQCWRIWIKIRIKYVFSHPTIEARTAPFGGLEIGRFVITCPGMRENHYNPHFPLDRKS